MPVFARIALLSLPALVACSSGGAGTDDSSSSTAGALHQTGDAEAASETLLRCNVFESGGGPDQEVIVRRAGGALTLEELTEEGSTVRRALSDSEWASRVIQLRKEEPDDESTLTKEGRAWRNESSGGGFRTVGYADCSIDTTR